ncbi:tRNA ligase 1 isoform X3 [Senna tora]|uniref:tRNA ligase 1 isoform X3 n=1 Tax=Senna tora TaxID=362788 RepID=A0A834SEQ9_9FABA|nr:tRNA ligase 1 isoform X3 [Senna tora]
MVDVVVENSFLFMGLFCKRIPQNQDLVGSVGTLVRTEDFIAIVGEGMDEEGDLEAEKKIASPRHTFSVTDTVRK